MAANKRTQLSNKIRFEVFKRDSFTCQYCGKKAPDVILNVDHINPVKRGGRNELLNLITSCFECNNGKRATPLSDNSIVEKQRQQIIELNERRNQLELMLKWRDDVKNQSENELEAVIAAVNENMAGYEISSVFQKELLKLVKKYGYQNVLEAVDISAERYIQQENHENYENYLTKITGIVKNLSLPMIEQKVNYISGYLSKSYNKKFWLVKSLLMDYCDALKSGFEYNDDEILHDLDTAVTGVGRECKTWWHFSDRIEGWIHDINENSDI